MSVLLPVCLTLIAHPATPHGSVRSVTTTVDRDADDGLRLSYTLTHDGRLLLPAPQRPQPADGLWTHTCCEAFIAVAGETGYREYNFSPSTQWAAYDFSTYRQRAATTIDALPAPAIEVSANAHRLHVNVCLPAALLPSTPPGRLLMLGLSAVCEARDGSLQYWALRHPAERPDFHDRRSFALAVAPTTSNC